MKLGAIVGNPQQNSVFGFSGHATRASGISAAARRTRARLRQRNRPAERGKRRREIIAGCTLIVRDPGAHHLPLLRCTNSLENLGGVELSCALSVTHFAAVLARSICVPVKRARKDTSAVRDSLPLCTHPCIPLPLGQTLQRGQYCWRHLRRVALREE